MEQSEGDPTAPSPCCSRLLHFPRLQPRNGSWFTAGWGLVGAGQTGAAPGPLFRGQQAVLSHGACARAPGSGTRELILHPCLCQAKCSVWSSQAAGWGLIFN